MYAQSTLLRVNFIVMAFTVAVLLGCGGDLATTQPGSTEEKLNGNWAADPLPGGGEIRHTDRELDFTFVEYAAKGGGPGFVVDYREWQVRKDAEPTHNITPSLHRQISPVAVNGLTAASDRPKHDAESTWTFRLDAEKPGTLYATWAMRDGTKRLDEVEFRRKR